MNRRWLPTGLFAKYSLTYFVTMLVPVLLISVFMFEVLFSRMEATVMENNREQTVKLMQAIDAKLMSIRKDRDRLMLLAGDYRAASKRVGFGAFELSQELKQYGGEDYILDILLIFSEGDMFFGTKGTVTHKADIDKVYQSGEGGLGEAIQTATAPEILKQRDIQHNSRTDAALTFIYPLGKGLAPAYGWVVFLVRTQPFLGIEGSFLDNRNGLLMLYDEKQRLVAHDARSRLAAHMDEGDALIWSLDTVNEQVWVDEQSEFAARASSAATGWTCLTMLPAREIMGPLYDVRRVALIVLALAGALGLLLASSFSRYIYKPIRRLKEFAGGQSAANVPVKNELDFTRFIIADLSQQRVDLQEKVRVGRDAQRYFLLMNLIKGKYQDWPSFNEAGTELGIEIPEGQYVSVAQMVLLNRKDAPEPPEAFCRILEQAMNEGGDSAIAIEHFDQPGVFMLLLMSPNKGNQTLVRRIVTAQGMMLAQRGVRFSVGLGNAHRDIQDVSHSYLESIAVIDFIAMQDQPGIVLYEDLNRSALTNMRHPSEYVSLLEVAITDGDWERAADGINTIADWIKGAELPLPYAKCLCYDVVNTLFKSASRSSTLQQGASAVQFDVVAYLNFRTIDELTEMLRADCRRIFERSQGQLNVSRMTADQVMLAIHNHYLDADFSVKTLAAMFDVSPSNLSHFIKSRTGEKPSELIDGLRMEYALKLLETTDHPVKEITQMCGFCDASNFIRKFKAQTGDSPNSYRNKLRERQQSDTGGMQP